MAATDGLVIKVVNIVAFLALLGSNIYSVAGPTDIYKNVKDTYVTPSYYANYIWSLIHFLLIGTMCYQFTEKGKAIIVDGVQWRFALLAVLNFAYVWLWGHHWYITSFILSLLVSATVSQIYYIIKTAHRRETLAQEVFVHAPFSLWHGFSIVLVVISGFTAFGRDAAKHPHVGLWSKVFVFLAFVFLESTAVGYAWASREGDIAGASVIAFSLFAIFIRQTHSKFVHWSAFAFFILSLFNIIKSVYGTVRSGNSILDDEERAPLVSGAGSS